MTTQDIPSWRPGSFKSSVALKLLGIGFLTLLLLIPAFMVYSLILERKLRRDSVVAEIAEKWGGAQTITGPFLTVPFRVPVKVAEAEYRYETHYLHILPETLDVTGQISAEVRYRSIFEAIVYTAALQFAGTFNLPRADELASNEREILWDKAHLSVGITDLRGVRDKITIRFDGSAYEAEPALRTTDLAKAGVSARLPRLVPGSASTFSFALSLNGSGLLRLIPVGETTTATLGSRWPSPSFDGAFLPVAREIRRDGFKAQWKVLHLNRNYPQFWVGSQYSVDPSGFGVQLIQPADIYRKSARLVKYAIIFLVFTFSAFFLSELLSKRRVHLVQYSFVGMALVLFYALLLSISEHIHFNYAYILSAAATTILIAAYSKAIIPGARFALAICALLTVVYSFLFVVLQLEDYALLIGSVGLFVMLAAMMYLTRRIDWYKVEMEPRESGR